MFRASLCPSSGEQRPCYCIWCVVLVLLDVVGSGCGALPCRMWALWRFLLWPVPVSALRVHLWLCAVASRCPFHLVRAISRADERSALCSRQLALLAPSCHNRSTWKANRSMHRPAHRVTAWQKRDWGRIPKLAHMEPRLGAREVCLHCLHCQGQTLHTVSNAWGLHTLRTLSGTDIAHSVERVRTVLSNVTTGSSVLVHQQVYLPWEKQLLKSVSCYYKSVFDNSAPRLVYLLHTAEVWKLGIFPRGVWSCWCKWLSHPAARLTLSVCLCTD
jgi:hypothetical protein